MKETKIIRVDEKTPSSLELKKEISKTGNMFIFNFIAFGVAGVFAPYPTIPQVVCGLFGLAAMGAIHFGKRDIVALQKQEQKQNHLNAIMGRDGPPMS